MGEALIGRALLQMDLGKGNIGAKLQGQMRELQVMGAESGRGIGAVIGGTLSKAFLATEVLGAGLVAVGVGSLKVAADFQTAMTLVHTQAGYSTKDLDALRTPVINLSKEFGISAKDLADGLYRIASSSIPPSQALGALRASAMLAKVGNSQLEVTTNAVAAAMKAYGIAGKDAIKVADVLNATVGAGNMRMEDLAQSIGLVLPMASQLNVPLEQVGANLATLTQKGVNTAEAVTALNGLFGALAAPGHAAKQALASIHMTADDLRKMLGERGLAGTIVELDRRTKGNIDTLHHLVPNIRALRDVLGVTGASAQDYKNNLAAINASHAKGNDLTAMWADTQADFNVKLDQGKARLEAQGIALGTRLMPIAERAIPIVADLAEKGFAYLNIAMDKAPGVIAQVQSAFRDAQESITNFRDNMIKLGEVLKAPAIVLAAVLTPAALGWAIAVGTTAVIATYEFIASLVESAAAAVMSSIRLVTLGYSMLIYVGQITIGRAATLAWNGAQVAAAFAQDLHTFAMQRGYIGTLRYVAGLTVSKVATMATTAVTTTATFVQDLNTFALQRGYLGTLRYVAGLTAAAAITGAVKVATFLWTAAQWLLNVALSANPIGIVIVVIAALAAGIIYAYQHSKEFRAVVDFLFASFKAFVSWLWKEVQPVFEMIGEGAKKAGELLQYLNPFAKHSPALIDQVRDGTALISAHYGKMADDIGDHADRARAGLNALARPLSGGNLSLGGTSTPSRAEVLLEQGVRLLESIDRQLQQGSTAGAGSTGATTIRGVLGALAANAEQAARRGQRGEYVGAVP